MAGGGARRGTLVAHYVAGHRRPLLDRGSPETEQGPAVANPRIRVCSTVVFSCRPLPCAIVERMLRFRVDRETNTRAFAP